MTHNYDIRYALAKVFENVIVPGIESWCWHTPFASHAGCNTSAMLTFSLPAASAIACAVCAALVSSAALRTCCLCAYVVKCDAMASSELANVSINWKVKYRDRELG